MTQSPNHSITQSRNRSRAHLLPSLRYLLTPEVHVYASSIAANALLSFFPFTLILLTVCRRWLHWEDAYQVILQLLRVNLPTGAGFVIRSLVALAQGRRRLQVLSVLMLFFTSSGIFLPLEVALNKIWDVRQNRSFLRNQAISFLLAVVSGVLALLSILLTAGAQWLIRLAFGSIRGSGLASVASRGILEVISIPSMIVLYFMIYYFLPNRRLPAGHVLPAAVLAGLVTEFGKLVYLFSLPLFKFGEVYGPFTLSVTLLFWAFAGALILLWGARVSAQVSLGSPERQDSGSGPGI